MSSKKEKRKQFRDGVFKRDKYTCQICGFKYSKDVSDPSFQIINAHHITDRNEINDGGYIIENGITVCDEKGSFPGDISCHMLVESYHLLKNNPDSLSKIPKEYLPESLYKKINSSLELVIKKTTSK